MDITNTRTAISSRLRRTAAVTAVAATGLALVGAGPASAESKNGSAPAKKGCTIEFKGPGAGQSITCDHGYSMSIQARNDGKTHTYTCNDGKWEETVSLTAGSNGGLTAPIGSLQVLDSGAAQLDTRVAGAAARGRSGAPGGSGAGSDGSARLQ
jgi:hypothetical protein